MHKTQVIAIMLIVVALVLGACTSTPESTSITAPTAQPASPQSTILGKWRHGLPDECPPNVDPRFYEKIKKLPENETYYLEFFKTGEVLYIDDEGWIYNGTYRFISDEYVEITWNVLVGSLAWELFGGHGVYEVQISGETMYLKGGQGLDTSYRRVD